MAEISIDRTYRAVTDKEHFFHRIGRGALFVVAWMLGAALLLLLLAGAALIGCSQLRCWLL